MAESSRFVHDEGDPSDQVSLSARNAANDPLSASQPIVPPVGLTLLHTLACTARKVHSASWSPDGKWLASSGFGDEAVQVWNPSTGKLLHTLDDHTDRYPIMGSLASWSPGGKWLASGSSDGYVRVWDPSTGKLLHTLKGHMGRVGPVTWSPDGKWLASHGANEDRVQVWDPGTGKLLHTLESHVRYIISVAWSPDGKWLASGSSDEKVRVWDPSTGKLLHTLEGHIREVVWSPDGKWLASGAADEKVRVWDSSTGKLLHTLEGHPNGVRSVAWSPDGKWLASGAADGTIQVWDPSTGRLLHTLEGHTNWVEAVVWSPDGNWLASDSHTRQSPYVADVRIWHSGTWEPLVVLTNLEGTTHATWHPHLPFMVTAGQCEEDLFIWHLDLALLLQAAPLPETVHYTSAKVVLAGDGGVGKSGLALTLTGQPFTLTHATGEREILLLSQQDVEVKNLHQERREIWLWDQPGQSGYRPLPSQFYLPEITVALIVFDAAFGINSFDSIRHWHRTLHREHQARGPVALPLTILLVAARIDRGGWGVSRTQIETLLKELDCASYIETSARDGQGIVELRKAIDAAINWDKLPKVTSTRLAQTIKAFMLEELQAGRILRTAEDLHDTFLRDQHVLGSKNELHQQFDTALRQLEAQGIIRWLSFGNLILLNPGRMDTYISELFNAVRDDPDGLGSIPEERVLQGDFVRFQEDRLPDLIQEKLLLIAMIDELVRQQLVLHEESSLLFPSQITREDFGAAETTHASTIIFNIAGSILLIYTTLVVRLAQCGIFQKAKFWRFVATYTTPLGGIYGLRLSRREGRAELGIFFDDTAREETCFHFAHFVQMHLERYAGGEVRPQRQVVCPGCGSVFPKEIIASLSLLGRDHIFCSICSIEISLPDKLQRLAASSASRIREMERVADSERERESRATIRQGKVIIQETNKHQLLASQNTAQSLHIYISSASTLEDESLLDELEKQLSMLRRQPNIYLWEKRLISPGANQEQEITAYLQQAHLILLLVSPDFLASDLCYEEMEVAAKQKETRGAWVLPVLIRHTAGWQETPVGMLEPLPVDRKPIRDRIDREEAMQTAAERIQDIVRIIRQSLTEGLQ
jgi:small GTP-binding protein